MLNVPCMFLSLCKKLSGKGFQGTFDYLELQIMQVCLGLRVLGAKEFQDLSVQGDRGGILKFFQGVFA